MRKLRAFRIVSQIMDRFHVFGSDNAVINAKIVVRSLHTKYRDGSIRIWKINFRVVYDLLVGHALSIDEN